MPMWRVIALVLCLLPGVPRAAAEYVSIGGGSFATVLPPDNKAAPAVVAAYRLRSLPVTNGEFVEFVRAHPEWNREHIAKLFADASYLSHWPAAGTIGPSQRNQPVTHVSWFAAQAYCESEQARLPTWYEFEYAAAADETRADARSDPAWRERILDWYSRPSTMTIPDIGRAPKNFYGISDLHCLAWEWVGDYASLMISGDNRDQGDPDLLKFCGAGALSTQDRENYAILMRIALLSSLKAADTTANLGFRCARNATGDQK